MNNSVLKNFAIGFIPIFVFIIVDGIFGTIAGLITAVITGLVYFVYYYWHYRKIEKMILLDTTLIVLTGGISILFNNAIFFKLKPAIIESIMTVLVAIHAFSNRPVLLDMGKRYMADMPVNEMQMQLMKQLSRILFFVLILHTGLIVYSAFYWSEGAWAFVSGGLFYILLGVLVVGQFVYIRFIKKPPAPAMFTQPASVPINDDDELFDVVDEKGRIIGTATRSQVHGHPQLIHPVVHLHIINDKGQLYLQKRADSKDLFPGYWDTAVGGHVRHGESVADALIRESLEELGIKPTGAKALFQYLMRNSYESELVHVFKMRYNGPFKINREEVKMGRFFSVFEIKKLLGQGIFTPNFEQEFRILTENKLL